MEQRFLRLGLVLSAVAVIGVTAVWSQISEARRDVQALRAELAQSQERLGEVEKAPCPGTPQLGDRMNVLARRFAAVWFAAKNGNRDLVRYELHEMEEVIESIELLRPIENGVDVAAVLDAVAHTQVKAMREAVDAKDPERFEAAYADTIDTCNACHYSADHPFIRITTPSASPVPNRVWSPRENVPRTVLVRGQDPSD